MEENHPSVGPPSATAAAQSLISEYLESGDYHAEETFIDGDECLDWVKMRNDPRRFHPGLFVGAWAEPEVHPEVGPIRILRIMTGPDRVTRAIARQGKNLFVFPWL